MINLPSSIHSLSRAEKFELLDAIWNDLESDARGFLGEDQVTELDRRVSRYEQDRSATTSWEELKAEVYR